MKPRGIPRAVILAAAVCVILSLAALVALVGASRPSLSQGLASPGAVAVRFPDDLLFFDSNVQAFVLVDGGGREIAKFGVEGRVLGRPLINPRRTAVAFWRDRDFTSDLIILDLGTGNMTTVASTHLIPFGMTWSLEGSAVAYTVASPPSERPPDAAPSSGQLVLVDLASDSSRQLAEYRDQFPLVPIFTDSVTIAGIRKEGPSTVRYEVIDVATSQSVASSKSSGFASTQVDPRSGLVIGLARAFESSQPSQLRIWRPSDYEHPVSVVEFHGLLGVVPLPTADASLIGLASGEIRRLEYGRNGSEEVVRLNGPVVPRAVSDDGLAVIVDRPAKSGELGVLSLRSLKVVDFRLSSATLTPAAEVIGSVAAR